MNKTPVQVALYTEVMCFIGLDPTTGQPLEELPTVDGAFTERLFLDSSNGHNLEELTNEVKGRQTAGNANNKGNSYGYGMYSDTECASNNSFTSAEWEK